MVLIPSAGVMISFDNLVWTCFFNEAVLLGLAGVGIQPDDTDTQCGVVC